MERVYSPLSSDTVSMSDVTDTRCAVSRGDFAAGASSLGLSAFCVGSGSLSESSVSSSSSSSSSSSLSSSSSSSLLSLLSLGTCGTAGAGESVLPSCTVDDEDSSRWSSDRDRDCERSACECGRGELSSASSKLSYTAAYPSANWHCGHPCLLQYKEKVDAYRVLVRTMRARGPLWFLVHVCKGGRCGLLRATGRYLERQLQAVQANVVAGQVYRIEIKK